MLDALGYYTLRLLGNQLVGIYHQSNPCSTMVSAFGQDISFKEATLYKVLVWSFLCSSSVSLEYFRQA